MERQDVDRSSFTPDIERDLGRDQPVACGQHSEHPLDEIGVTRIEQPIQALALPKEPKIDSRAERRRDAHQDVHGHSIGMPALDPPDGCPRDLRPRRDQVLGPRAFSTQSPDAEPEADDVHPASMNAGAARSLMPGNQVPAAPASGTIGVTSPVGWMRKIQMSQVTWLTTSAPSGTPAA